MKLILENISMNQKYNIDDKIRFYKSQSIIERF
jgi:hypothetical protein